MRKAYEDKSVASACVRRVSSTDDVQVVCASNRCRYYSDSARFECSAMHAEAEVRFFHVVANTGRKFTKVDALIIDQEFDFVFLKFC